MVDRHRLLPKQSRNPLAALTCTSDGVRPERRVTCRVTLSNGHLHGGKRTEAAARARRAGARAARVVVADCLGDRVAASVFHNAQLLMSGAVTNSVRHSGMPAVSVNLTPGMVRLDVEDPGHAGTVAPHAPTRAPAAAMD